MVFVNRTRGECGIIGAFENRRAKWGGEPMADVTVYFATNRVPRGATTDWQSYRADIIPPTDPSKVIYAEAFVEGSDLAIEGSGTITAISHPQTGGFETGVAQDPRGHARPTIRRH